MSPAGAPDPSSERAQGCNQRQNAEDAEGAELRREEAKKQGSEREERLQSRRTRRRTVTTTLRYEDVADGLVWDGALREVYLVETTMDEWQSVMAALLAGPWPIELSTGHTARPSSDALDLRSIFDAEETSLMSVDVAGAIFNCHFFSKKEIEFDVWPTEVTAENFDEVLSFLRLLGNAARRNVLFGDEGSAAAGWFGYCRESGVFTLLERPTQRTALGEQLRSLLRPVLHPLSRQARSTEAALAALRGDAGSLWSGLYHPDEWRWHTDLMHAEYHALYGFSVGVSHLLAVGDGQVDAEREQQFVKQFWESVDRLAAAFDIDT